MARLTRGDEMRQRRAHPFVAIPNTTIRDKRLSLRARGLLGLLLSQSEDWSFSHKWLGEQVDTDGPEGEGREAIATALRELRRLGYYRVERRHMLADGTFRSGGYVSDEPVAEWATAYAAACTAGGTRSPRWDVTVRVLADGTVEDEPRRPGDTPAANTLGEDVCAGGDGGPDPRKPVTGPVPGNPVTGSPGDRVAGDLKKTNPEDHPEEVVTTGGVSHVSTGARDEPPSSTPPAAPSAPAAPDGDALGAPPVRSCRRWPAPHGACGACAADREALAAWEAAAHRDALDRAWAAAEAERRRRDDARALAAAQLRACRLCDQDGLLPSGLRCLHDPDANPRAGEGGRAAWAKAREDLAARRPRADTRPRRRDGGRRQAG
jgi:hypothetical protein